MKTKKKIIILGAAMALVVALACSASLAGTSAEDTMKKNFNEKFNEYQNFCRSDHRIMMGIDRAAAVNNDKFRAIVDLGPEYLPIIIDKINQGQGSDEFRLTYAAYLISKVDCSEGVYSVSDWRKKWNEHLKAIPGKIEEIKTKVNKNGGSKMSETDINEIDELGIPAVPYLIEEIEKGNDFMIEPLKLIMKDDKTLPSKDDVSKLKVWTKENKSKFKKIKDMVEEAKEK